MTRLKKKMRSEIENVIVGTARLVKMTRLIKNRVRSEIEDKNVGTARLVGIIHLIKNIEVRD